MKWIDKLLGRREGAVTVPVLDGPFLPNQKLEAAPVFCNVDQADNLRKYGGFIPGVRPGRPTAEFLDRILARLTFPGALFLAAVAALPAILFARTHQNFYFGGTSILIVIGVALETMKQLEAQLMMRSYEGFLK